MTTPTLTAATGTAPTGTAPASAGPQPRTAIYRGTVRHRRFSPRRREFAPALFLAYLDVDALPGSLDAIPLWSARRPAPVRFRRRDFFDGGDRPLGDAVRDLVAEELGRRPTGPVHLLAHLRTFGWLHNPLTVYYCWAARGTTVEPTTLDAIVLEVTNTPWGERHRYVIDASGGRVHATQAKAMHVSPFLPMDLDYRVTWNVPGEHLRLRVEAVRDSRPVFDAALALDRVPLDGPGARAAMVRYPFMTLRVSTGIYAQALRLFLARIPVYRHPAPRDPSPIEKHLEHHLDVDTGEREHG